jgi:glycosyltransferase involved in cell wall biosynthesis
LQGPAELARHSLTADWCGRRFSFNGGGLTVLSSALPRSFIVAQLGARMHYAAPRVLHNAGMLTRFYTDLCAVKGWPRLLGVVPPAFRPPAVRRLLGRVPKGLSRDRITAFTSFGLEYARRLAAAGTRAEVTAAHLWVGRTFCELILRRGLNGASGVYTFNSAGLELLRHARVRGLLRVMEQTSAPAEVEDELLAAEHSAFPGWEPAPGADPYRAEFAAREQAEWECSDLILCGSEFVREGIAKCGGPIDRCAVVPYGVDCVAPANEKRERGSRLRVLIVGGVRLQKGAHYVLEAARALRGLAEFRWCGGVALLPEAASQLKEHVELRGVVPRTSMSEHYAWGDVLLFPSVCDGFGAVILEALASGLPVITTRNTGIVARDGIDGFIVPIRDGEAIARKLELLARDRELLAWMSANATARSREFTVEKYGERLLAAIRQACANRQAISPMVGS